MTPFSPKQVQRHTGKLGETFRGSRGFLLTRDAHAEGRGLSCTEGGFRTQKETRGQSLKNGQANRPGHSLHDRRDGKKEGFRTAQKPEIRPMDSNDGASVGATKPSFPPGQKINRRPPQRSSASAPPPETKKISQERQSSSERKKQSSGQGNKNPRSGLAERGATSF